MLPPTPAATIAFKSPNACNICHKDKDAPWADKLVRQWRTRDYQDPVLKRAALIDAARKRDWTKLPEMLAYISDPKRDESSLPRSFALSHQRRTKKFSQLCSPRQRTHRPCARSSGTGVGPGACHRELASLIEATGDDYRLVRVRAAAGIAAFRVMAAPPAYQAQLKKANDEYLASITRVPTSGRPLQHGQLPAQPARAKKAVDSYQTALKLDPQALLPMVNISMAYAQMGEGDKAEKSLQKRSAGA